MLFMRLIFAFLFPPLAVVDKGCGTTLIVFALTLAGWLPGVFAAMLILLLDAMHQDSAPVRTVVVPARASRTVFIPDLDDEPLKRGPRYLESPDGRPLEIIDDPDADGDVDSALLARRRRLSNNGQ
jgi:uncharacterized membrane protein YqaE (UPF0057 family)